MRQQPDSMKHSLLIPITIVVAFVVASLCLAAEDARPTNDAKTDNPVWRLWSPSDYAAWYGAVVATIVFFWEIWKAYVQRPKLRLTARLLVTRGVNDGQQVIQIAAVNLRGRPIVLDSLSTDPPDPEMADCLVARIDGHPNMPHELANEGAQFETLLRPSFFNAKHIKRFVATDTCGRKWKSNRYPIQEVSGELVYGIEFHGVFRPDEHSIASSEVKPP